jgi:CxxC motif-containing protein
MKKTVICTICPNGCEIEVDYTTREDATLTGNLCKRGVAYAINECFEPKRTFTSSVKISGTDRRVMPVRTTDPIAKELLMKAAEELKTISLEAPIECGTVIVDNFLGTDAKLVATMTLERGDA